MSDKELENGVSVSPESDAEVKTETVETEKSDDVVEMSDIIEKGKDAVGKAKDAFSGLSKNVKMIALAVVALILIILVASCAAGSTSRFTKAEVTKSYFLRADNEKLINLEGTEIETDERISGVTYSADKSLTVVEDVEDTLYVVKGKELVEVAEEVDYYVVSNYGDTIAYVTDVKDGMGTLYLFTVSKKSSVEITDEAYAGNIVLSPNGKSVAYLGDIEEDNWYSVIGDLYVSKNGKEGKKLYSDAVPLAISDNGKHVFYMKDSEKLYMNEEKLSSKLGSHFYFTEDYKEIIFNEDGEAHYYTVKMKEPVKVKKEGFSSIYTPADTLKSDQYAGNYYVHMYGVDSFNETIWNLGGSAYYVFKKGEETEKVSSGMYQYQMSENGKGILFLDTNNDICYIKNVDKSREVEKLAKGMDIDSFTASKDLKKIYFYDYDEDELCYLKKGEGVRIADDANKYIYSDKYGVLYFIEDGELFYATTSAKSKKDVIGEEVSYLMHYGDYIIFSHENDDDDESVNVITGKKKYEELFSED